MKKLLAMILAVCLLSGCSLAVRNPAGEDRLTGFFVTVSRETEDGTTVDYWDEEATGMEMISYHYLKGRKLYAQRTGDDPVIYALPEGCGLSCFSYDVTENGQVTYRNNTISPEIDVRLEHHAGTQTPYRMEAVVYGTGDPDLVLTCNPVYQTPAGEVYVLSAEPASFATDMAGSAWLGREEGENGCAYTLTIEQVLLPESYVITEMSAEHQPLARYAYAPGQMPETYTPGSDAAYLILEARAGADTVRSVYSPGDSGTEMDTYYPGAYGLCIKGYTRIEWNNQE